ncbi:Rad51 [Nesidiocoris tenuis]|uniref:Rad51 n=1 Tax=Nesidiocoris tenuis TaxID=355587 RepID=A0ABN7AW40_9HEMI|nr:Rad51 [Nesidiocoris tenuis]
MTMANDANEITKRLDQIVDPQLVDTLAKHKIFLVHDFYLSDTDKLSKITGLHPKAILKLKTELASHLPRPINAYEEYSLQLTEGSIIKTSIPGLDEILGGGLRTGSLLELCGTSGCGKTQICLNLAINIVAQHNVRVMYVDTKRDLVPSHFSAVVDALGYRTEKAAILSRVMVTRPDTIYSLISTLHGLQGIQKREKRIKILIIDSVVDLYYPFLNDQDNDGLGLLSHIASLSHHLSTAYKLAVLFVNLGTRRNVFKEESHQDDSSLDTHDFLTPSLGKVWIGVPQTRLILSRKSSNNPVRSLTVHRSLTISKESKSKVYILPDGTVK